jgi:hypothetical protein
MKTSVEIETIKATHQSLGKRAKKEKSFKIRIVGGGTTRCISRGIEDDEEMRYGQAHKYIRGREK